MFAFQFAIEQILTHLMQTFDELIRQVTINCAERGLLLLRVREYDGIVAKFTEIDQGHLVVSRQIFLFT